MHQKKKVSIYLLWKQIQKMIVQVYVTVMIITVKQVKMMKMGEPPPAKAARKVSTELLEQLNMTDLDDKGVKIYNSGIKYTVSHKDLHQDLPEARHINRQKIKQAVTDKLD